MYHVIPGISNAHDPVISVWRNVLYIFVVCFIFCLMRESCADLNCSFGAQGCTAIQRYVHEIREYATDWFSCSSLRSCKDNDLNNPCTDISGVLHSKTRVFALVYVLRVSYKYIDRFCGVKAMGHRRKRYGRSALSRTIWPLGSIIGTLCE